MRKRYRFISLLLVMLMLIFALAGCGGSSEPGAPSETDPAESEQKESEAWAPSKQVTLIVQAAAGGGSDLFARTFAKIANDKELSPYTIVVENMPAAGGADAYNYVGKTKHGDPHFLATAVTNLVTVPLQGMMDITHKDFTPIARMGCDNTYSLVVPGNSPWNTIEELIEYAKANPEEINLGGGNIGSADSVATYLIEEGVGINFNYVPFAGGGEVVTAGLGGHVDAMIANAAEVMDYVNNGDLKILATLTDERLKITPDVPTFKEKGYKGVNFEMFRGIVAPGGIPEEAAKFWEELARKVYDTPEWQEDYLKANVITPGWMDGEEFGQELERQEEFYTDALTALGII